MTDKALLALYGLKYNPFVPALPSEELWPLPGGEVFARRLEALVHHGGFAVLTGDPGQCKSKTLQWIAARLARLPDLTVGVMERPQSRLPDRFRTPELLPLGSRIRARLALAPLSPEELWAYLDFTLQEAGAPQLMTSELSHTLVTHAHGNLRVLTHMAAELLSAAAERNLPRIDETLYFELFTPPARTPRRSRPLATPTLNA